MGHRGVGVARRATDRGDELRVQKRHVRRGHERQLALNGLQPRKQPLQRTLTLARVLDHLDRGR